MDSDYVQPTYEPGMKTSMKPDKPTPSPQVQASKPITPKGKPIKTGKTKTKRKAIRKKKK
jgi:hypothetical protein